jgi:hypothetical protein
VSTQLHQGALNVVGWVIVAAGFCAFIAAGVGLILVASAASRHSPTAVTQELHGTYYVISHTKHAVGPLIALLIFSVCIMIGGYIHTDRFVNYLLHRYVEKAPPA